MKVACVRHGEWEAEFWLFGEKLIKVFPSKKNALCFFENLKSVYVTDVKSLKEVCDHYLTTISVKKSRNSYLVDKLTLALFFEYLHTKDLKRSSPITLITLSHIEGFQSYLTTERKLKSGSVNRYFATLKNFFNKAHAWGFIIKNPCEHVSQLQVKSKEKSTWTEAQFLSVYRKLDNDDQRLLMFLKLTGARLSSAARLKVSDLDFNQKAVFLKSNKGARALEKVYAFPMHQALEDFLIQQVIGKSSNDFVFLKNNMEHNCKNFSKRISKVLSKIGLKSNDQIKQMSLHGIRHSLATQMHDKGFSVNEVKTLLGHSSIVVTQTYLHTESDQLLNKLNKKWG